MYPQYPYNFYQQPYQQPIQQSIQQTQQTQQIQSGGFVSVPNEEVVRNYPVAPGNCVTFKIEGQPVVMEKSMGFSQLESPQIEKYQLVKMEQFTPQMQAPKAEYVSISEYNTLKELVEYLDNKVENLEGHFKKPKKARLAEESEEEA